MSKKLLDKCDTLKKQSILVIGDIMLDEYHWCEVKRISPEAPVPVCKVTKTTLVPGGASNVAFNIDHLQGRPILIGTVGQDSSGEKLISILNQTGIQISGIVQDFEKPTILKSRIIANQQHVARVDRENSSDVRLATRNKLFSKIEEEIKGIGSVLLSDYQKGTMTRSFLKRVIELAKKHKKTVIVDPKGDDYLKYKGATILTPNFSEFTTVIKKKVTKEKDIEIEGKRLIKKLQLKALLVTRSEKGMSLITEKEKIDIPTMAKEVFDITGAGDTVIATLAQALAAKCTFEDAARIANYAASVVVGKLGTSTTTLEEIKKVIKRDSK
ncbi:D-glycero-beta-D-manno-heptose-7-phosphate kinase [Candidatus Marinamargulisbacteria bacterium SCGC AAA071-K20]|nr:D-glycero-beta-D-manno-heptose-7-phosphate kinase [Candidatus Marinamargulisbacteria bacterium SCGC AAA071-K20]